MKRSVTEYPLAGKRVFCRVDFNEPIVRGEVADDMRIRATLPTINYLLEQDCSVILASHLDRPQGKVVEGSRLEPVARRLQELTGRRVRKMDDCVGPEVREAAKRLQPGEIMLLENVRFYAEETANDRDFARQLAELADVYVDDAFGAAHRAHASIEGITRFLPSVAGLLMIRELEILSRLLRDPARPFIVVLGGAKVSQKITLIRRMLRLADRILVGGAMANAFLVAQGHDVGRSLCEADQVEVAAEVLAAAATGTCRLLLPTDVVVADEAAAGAAMEVVPVDGIDPQKMALDIGPETIKSHVRELRNAGTIYWNGPMGLFEINEFGAGTKAIGEAMAASASVTVAGGGDTVAAARKYGLEARFTHVSTGGGASLQFLEGRSLPGVEALMERGVTAAAGRRPLIAGNWKMYKTRPETVEYLREFVPLVRSAGERDVVVCPSFVCLESAMGEVVRTNVAIGAQTMAASDEGASTGEVSPEMLREVGAHYVILGHSERRNYPSDTDRMLAHKVRAALNKGIRPILCVGETLEERESGLTEAKVGGQIDAGLADVSAAEFALVAVAYEPIWAIGTGRQATPDMAQETISFMRERLRSTFGGAADAVRILYGGSVNGGSIDALMAQPDIDGVLVGGASLDPNEFARIVRFVEPA